MNTALTAAERSRAYFRRYLTRPGCHPCDRSEAGIQLSRADNRIKELESAINILENGL